MATRIRPSPLSLVVLGMLALEPLHPYGIQRLIKLWGKDQVVNVGQRSTLYKTIGRLERAGLVAVRQTEREQQFPERTVYEITEEGRRQGREWLVEMLSTPRNEYPEFPAAVSMISALAPDECLVVLELRAQRLSDWLAGVEAELADNSAHLPRVTMLESEYQRAVAAAELFWLKGVIADLRSGALSWGAELETMARSYLEQ